MTARWPDGKSLEEYLFDDNGTFLQQIGPHLCRREPTSAPLSGRGDSMSTVSPGFMSATREY
jgi:hypothetical protein